MSVQGTIYKVLQTSCPAQNDQKTLAGALPANPSLPSTTFPPSNMVIMDTGRHH